MVAPAIIAAGIGAGAGLLGGLFQNSAASSAADKQMAFQERSARHSYQWAMEDMRKAGLNPILAYKQGGAGTLSGSSYTPQNVGAAAVSGASSASSSALAAQRQEAELANIAADTQLKGSQDRTQAALTTQAMSQAALANANSAVAVQEASNKVMEYDLMRESLIQALPKSTIAKLDNSFWSSEAAAPLLATRRIMESLAPGSTLANSAAAIAGR